MLARKQVAAAYVRKHEVDIMKVSFWLLGFIFISSCAGRADQLSSQEWSGSGTLIAGHEELYLVPEGRDATVSTDNCITVTSGSRGRAADYSAFYSKHVRIQGRAVAWPEGSVVFIRFGQDRVRNGCSSKNVIVLSKITLLD